jgi:hypothetical protein
MRPFYQTCSLLRLKSVESSKQAEIIQIYEKEHVRGVGQGEARHKKYKRLKLGGGQAYDRSSD